MAYFNNPMGGGSLPPLSGVQGLITDPGAGQPGGLLGNYHPALASYYNGMPTQIIRRSLRGDRLTDPNYDPRVIPGHPFSVNPPAPAPGVPDVAPPGDLAAPADPAETEFQKWRAQQQQNMIGDNHIEDGNFQRPVDAYDFNFDGSNPISAIGPGGERYSKPAEGLMGMLASKTSPASILGALGGLALGPLGSMALSQGLGQFGALSQPLFGGGSGPFSSVPAGLDFMDVRSPFMGEQFTSAVPDLGALDFGGLDSGGADYGEVGDFSGFGGDFGDASDFSEFGEAQGFDFGGDDGFY